MSDQPTAKKSSEKVPAPYWDEVFWRLTPTWVQNWIDRTRKKWLQLKFHFTPAGHEGHWWGCGRTEPCWCDLYYSPHGPTLHLHCRHCTNTPVICTVCGGVWVGNDNPLESTPPWSYLGVGKWRCNQCRK